MSESIPWRYPQNAAQRDAWIVSQRGPREPVDAEKPYAFLIEQERFANGETGPVATVFLTNKECPWHCTMCDLWRNTLTYAVPPGAIPRQIAYALSQLAPARQIKLYNSGSFFDPQAIPSDDYQCIAAHVNHFERVIVESHPSLIDKRCFRFQQELKPTLEVAMGLETAHPSVLERLNKKMTLEQYASAAHLLGRNGIALRSFILIQPPFMQPQEALYWTCRSIDFALKCGASAITLIPTRAGNGAMEVLSRAAVFTPPKFSTIEQALDYGIGLGHARVFVDLWDISRVPTAPCCRNSRIERLRQMNLSQTRSAGIDCAICGHTVEG